MSMRDQYENLDKYAAYDYKDVSNAYGHGEDDAIDRVLEIMNDYKKSYATTRCNGLQLLEALELKIKYLKRWS